MKKYTSPIADALAFETADVIAASFNIVEGNADFDANTHSIGSEYFAK